jgi:hypothetical protein
MSSRFASEQLASLRHDAQRFVEESGDQEDYALALVAVEDLNVASRSPARLLITASTPQAVETPARRIHGIGPRTQFPFVMTCAGELPIRVAEATFSERLFYRLNIIHLVAGAGAPEVTLT